MYRVDLYFVLMFGSPVLRLSLLHVLVCLQYSPIALYVLVEVGLLSFKVIFFMLTHVLKVFSVSYNRTPVRGLFSFRFSSSILLLDSVL